jgi:adenosine deaminase
MGLELADIVHLPKAHLHIHLEGSIRAELITQWCLERGIDEPDIASWSDLSSFLRELDKVKDLIPSPVKLIEAARLFMHDERADGVSWTEPQVNPFVLKDRGQPDDVVDAVLEGLKLGERETGVGFGLILAINRTRPLDEAMAVARIAAERANRGVIGLGLSNDEALGPADQFSAAFDFVRDTPLLRVPHAGEALGAESVRLALTLSPHRIMHGIGVLEDVELAKSIGGRGISFDMCPTCNVELGVVPSLQELPLRDLSRCGIRFSLSADCALLFRTSCSRELLAIATAQELKRSDVASLAADSIGTSAMPEAAKASMLARVDSWKMHPTSETDSARPSSGV